MELTDKGRQKGTSEAGGESLLMSESVRVVCPVEHRHTVSLDSGVPRGVLRVLEHPHQRRKA